MYQMLNYIEFYLKNNIEALEDFSVTQISDIKVKSTQNGHQSIKDGISEFHRF